MDGHCRRTFRREEESWINGSGQKQMMVVMNQRVMPRRPLFNFTEEKEEESRTAWSVTQFEMCCVDVIGLEKRVNSRHTNTKKKRTRSPAVDTPPQHPCRPTGRRRWSPTFPRETPPRDLQSLPRPRPIAAEGRCLRERKQKHT